MLDQRSDEGDSCRENAEIQGIIGNLSVYQSELISEHLLSSHNEAITATKTLFFSYMPFTISDEEFYQEIVPIIYQHRFITPFIDITLRIMDLEFFRTLPNCFNSCRQFYLRWIARRLSLVSFLYF